MDFINGFNRNQLLMMDKVKHYKNRQACKTCSLRAQCTTNKNGRFIERSIYQEALEENQKRVDSNPDYYRLRQQITEHQFGTLKRQWGFTYVLMKGKENVLSEVNLMMICYNLRRLMSIFSVNDLKNKLKQLVIMFLPKMEGFKSDLTPLVFLPLISENEILLKNSAAHFSQIKIKNYF